MRVTLSRRRGVFVVVCCECILVSFCGLVVRFGVVGWCGWGSSKWPRFCSQVQGFGLSQDSLEMSICATVFFCFFKGPGRHEYSRESLQLSAPRGVDVEKVRFY